jgi:ADP-heptose:LPS heptosyltransferase
MAGRFPVLFVAEPGPQEAIFSSGLLKRLHDEVSNVAFTIVAGPGSAELFRDVPHLEALHVLEGEGRADWFGLWGKLRHRRWGLVVDMRGSQLAGWLRRRTRAVRLPPAPENEPAHPVVEAARVLKLEEDPPSPFLFVGDKVQAKADAMLKGQGPILAIAPGAEWVGRRWPAERYTKVAASLLGGDGPMAGGRLLIIGSEEDRDPAHTIRLAVARERLIEAEGKTDLITAYALLKRARLYVGGDSIWTHLAAAAGVPTIAAFGPSDDRLARPWGAHTRVVRGPRTFAGFKSLDPGLNQHINHMLDLRAEPVLEAALKLHAETEA